MTPDTPVVAVVHADGTECDHGMVVAWPPGGQPACRDGLPIGHFRYATFRHAEAFCLMYYAADDGSEGELVWNTRDGVTPFVIRLRDGTEATHSGHIVRPKRMPPWWQPPPGMRVFTDLTDQAAEEYATRRVDACLAGPDAGDLIACYGTRTAAIEALAAHPAGAPDLVDPGPGTAWRRP